MLMNEFTHLQIQFTDALNKSFVTLAQANFTPTGPSETTDANIKKYPVPRQVNSIIIITQLPLRKYSHLQILTGTSSIKYFKRMQSDAGFRTT